MEFSRTMLTGFVVVLACLCISYAFARENKNKERSSSRQRRNREFTWREEPWNNCIEGKTCEDAGSRRRLLTCVNSRGEKVTSRKCDRRSRPARKEYCVPDICRNQTNFKLRFWPWSSCASESLLNLQIPNVLNKNSTIQITDSNNAVDTGKYPYFGHGSNWKSFVINSCGSFQNTIVFVKKRNISCLVYWEKRNIKIKVPIEYCSQGADVPKSVQICSFGCKQKCSVGLWNNWESCQNCKDNLKFRERKISYFPYMNDSISICPPLVEMNRSVPSKPERQDKIQLKVSEWSSCKKIGSRQRSFPTSLSNRSAVVGTRTRFVTCVDGKGMRVKCENAMSGKLSRSESCILPRDCQLTQWSQWSTCAAVFERKENKKTGLRIFFQQQRSRKLSLTPLLGGKTCEYLTERRTCKPLESPSYEQEGKNGTSKNETFEWFVGKFDKCTSDAKDCRSGVMRRDVFCIRRGDTAFNPVGSQFCTHMNKPAEEAFCRNPCRDMCVLGEWGSWSACTADCKGNVSGLVRGTHYRVRRVIQYSGDPRACNDYAESRPCTLKNCVSWVAGTQTVCLMDNIHRACGNGKTHRAVYCMNARGHQVDERLCLDKKPPRSLPCHVPCSDDCVAGTWSGWGPCQGKCGVNGTQGDSYRSRRQRILAYPGWSGRPCPSSNELIEKQSCLGENCGTYHWEVSLFGACKVLPSRFGTRVITDNLNRRCMIGSRSRSVTCVNDAGKKANDHLCTAFLRPPPSKECRLCPGNCVLSPWTEWSPCPTTCSLVDIVSSSHFFRKRKRYIVSEGADGGRLCPNRSKLFQTIKCGTCNPNDWRSTGWSRCAVAPEGGCNGLKTRRVYCMSNTGERMPDGFCLLKSRKPAESIKCARSCDRKCVLTEWSDWGECSRACGTGYARRTRSVLGNRIQCKSTTKFSEDRPCNTHKCGQYSLRIDKWSQCFATDVKKNCGVGLQWRNISCFKISGSDAPLDYCIEELYGGKMTLNVERSCIVTCPLDCKLSSWTKYTPCSRKCGAGVKTRFRTIVQKATQGGQMCVSDGENNQIVETVPCKEKECFNFVWKADPWETCKITNQTSGRVSKCGTGFHSRKVYCIDKRFSGHRSVINDSLCDAAEKPSTRKPCSMYCPGDCAVGYWSSWSKCSSRCPKPGHRRRERTILRYPAHDGKSCPPLEEYQACNLKHCYTHYWRTTKWSTCLFYRDDTSCGVGRERRMVDCVRSDGKIVHPFHCRVEGRRVPTLLRVCNVPCPRNCEISEWEMWSPCPEKCGAPTVQRRIRYILAKAENGGQSCRQSDSLEEFRSCQMRPCHKLLIGEWGECKSDVDHGCGSGIQRRSVNCLRDDGRITDDSKCPQLITGDYPKIQSCNIPCSGDCVITMWTSWTACFGSCTIKNESVLDYGVRLRTRHVLQQADDYGVQCPKDLLQKEKCDTPSCFTFAWMTGSYVNKRRDVWCERSDGLRVSNGCNLAVKPSTTQSCQPKCTVSNSFCNAETICACKNDYIPIIGSHGRLIHCLSGSNSLLNRTMDTGISTSRSNGNQSSSWFGDLPIIIWVVIAVCFVYLLLFLAIVIVYTRRRSRMANQRRATTADIGTLTTPERVPLTQESIPLREKIIRHERSNSKTSFATSSGRGSTLSTISDHDDGENWPEPPDDVVAEFIRTHLKNFNGGSFCSTFSDESLTDQSRTFNSLRNAKFDAAGTL